MTVKELIRELEQLDGSLVVIFQTQEDHYEPSPEVKTWDFDSNYYTGKEFVTLPKGIPFVML